VLAPDAQENFICWYLIENLSGLLQIGNTEIKTHEAYRSQNEIRRVFIQREKMRENSRGDGGMEEYVQKRTR
jgi:hypothetical protein